MEYFVFAPSPPQTFYCFDLISLKMEEIFGTVSASTGNIKKFPYIIGMEDRRGEGEMVEREGKERQGLEGKE